MDENIQKLQQIDIKEITKQTRISSSRLKDIFEQNFTNFKRVHLVGFLQILEREYKLDLSGVLQAYDNFHSDGGINISYETDEEQDKKGKASNYAQSLQSAKASKNAQSTKTTKDTKDATKDSSVRESSTAFDFGVASDEDKPKQETGKKEIPQIDLRLESDMPQKQDSKEESKSSQTQTSAESKDSKKKDSKSAKDKKTIQNDISFDTQKRRYDSIDNRHKEALSKQRFYLTIVCAIIAVLIYLIYQNLSDKTSGNNQATQELIAPEDITREITESSEPNALQVEGQSEFREQNPQSENALEVQNPQNEQDLSTQSNPATNANEIAQQSQLQSLQPTQAPQPAPQVAGKLVIKAENMLWFDIVDLDTNRRKYQGVTSDTYSIDKDDNHRWLFAFGHSNFSLSLNGSAVEVPRLDIPLYFIYEPASGFKRVDNVTYKRLSDQAR